MLKYYNYDIVFQEIPNEITLAINITNCPHKCKGCHSPYLQKDIGTILDIQGLDDLIYKNAGISCICFMGGDDSINELNNFLSALKAKYSLKLAMYSGNTNIDPVLNIKMLDFLKIGPFDEKLGPLNSSITNQKLFKIVHEHNEDILIDITNKIKKIKKNIC